MVCDQWSVITDILSNGVEIIWFIASKKSNVNWREENMRLIPQCNEHVDLRSHLCIPYQRLKIRSVTVQK